jgi:hypothetical protein
MDGGDGNSGGGQQQRRLQYIGRKTFHLLVN